MISNNDITSVNFSSDQANEFANRGTTSNRKSRIGLTPTDGQDAYKRSAARASRRSRPERTSYMMANGHIDIDELQQLTGLQQHNSQHHDQLIPRHNSIDSHASSTTLTIRPDVSDQPALLNIAAPNHYADFQDNIFAHNNLKTHASKYKNNHNNKQDRAKVKQIYTEVAMPMKTSPAFEYIIKDNKRRNRRCCLWVVYSVLMTTCIAIIIYCSYQLVVRYQLI